MMPRFLMAAIVCVALLGAAAGGVCAQGEDPAASPDALAPDTATPAESDEATTETPAATATDGTATPATADAAAEGTPTESSGEATTTPATGTEETATTPAGKRRERRKLTFTPGAGPRGPGGTPGGPATPAEPELGANQFRLSADHVRVQDNAIVGEGRVKVQGKDFSVAADGVLLDADGIWMHFVGRVAVGAPSMRSTATRLDINIKTSKWRVTDGLTMVDPSYFSEGVADTLYLRGKVIETRPGSDVIEATAASATSCRNPHPHYDLRSSKIRVIPGDKVVFRRPSLHLFGWRIVRFPFDLTLSLSGKDNFIFPEIGENAVEGTYAKFAYLYTLNDENSGLARLNFTSKRGNGYGIDHTLAAAKQNVQLSVFLEPDEGAFSSRLNHTWNISDEWNWSLNSSLQKNTGYYGTSETMNTDWMLRQTTEAGSTQLGFQASTSTSDSYETRQMTSSFTHQQRIGDSQNLSVRATMRDSKYSADQVTDEELDTGLEYGGRQTNYDWQVVADKRYDLDGSRYTGDSSYRVINKMPQLTVKTDTDRMKSWRPLGRIYTRAEFELGRYEQDPDKLTVSRFASKLDFGGGQRRLSGNSTLASSARYYQALYDDGSAQYLGAFRSELRQKFGEHWTTRLTGDYSRPHGFAPIRLDSWGRQADVTYQMVRLSRNHSKIDLSTGRDLLYSRWRAALGQFEFMTSGSSKLGFQTGYDIESSKWRPLNATWTFVHPQQLRVVLSSQYDIKTSKLWQSGFDIDWTITPRTRVQTVGRYSGSTHRLDQMDVSVTRDLHCWLGSVSYSKITGDWQINLGLKAFPAVQTNFGTNHGARSQTGTGSYY